MKRTQFVISSMTLFIVIAVGVLAPIISPHDPLQPDIGHRLQPPVWVEEGSTDYVLGTDQLGRDILSRIIFGARTSLAVSGLAVAVGAVIGISLGLAAGYWRGPIATVLDRVADIQQTLPFIVLILAVAAVTGPSFTNVVLVLGISSWVVHYRVVRAAALAVREQPYIEAARAVGNSAIRIAMRHVLPNVLPSAIVNMTTFIPQIMLFEAALSFLGLGIPPPTPTWGGMIADGRGYIEVAWWMSVLPGLTLMLTALSVNVIGDRLNERLDPMQRRR